MRRFLFLVSCLSLLHLVSYSQSLCGPIPELIKSGTLSYDRLPIVNDTILTNFRFFYKMTVDCNDQPVLNDLFIVDPLFPTTIISDIPWQQDSVKNVTGLIDPCLVFQTPPCHRTFYYHADAQINSNTDGYTGTTVNCCRPYTTANLLYQFNLDYSESVAIYGEACYAECSPSIGTVYNGIASYVKVPPLSIINSSPQIVSNDTLLSICKARPFSYQVKAVEPDGDSLVYHFSAPRSFPLYPFNRLCYPRLSLPFPAIDFKPGFSAEQPAGPGVSIDPATGLIQGAIPDTGTYVVTISALEYRNQVLLDSTMQDLFIQVFDCSLLPKPEAAIPPKDNACNSLTVSFPNNSTPIINNPIFDNTTFQWEFGDGDSSQQTYPSHTYADTGTYPIRLIIFPGHWCADTAYGEALVYPILDPNFTHADSCSGQPVLFTNISTTSEGTIDSVDWKVLLDSTQIDSSNQYNLSYTFHKVPQTYTVLLTVGTDKGCLATDTQYVNIWQSPALLASHDTILSRGASLQLQASDGNNNFNGQFSWYPTEGLNDANIPNPILNSTTDTVYFVSIKNSLGCSLLDSIRIKYYTGPDIYVPNAFTPNGDGINDLFRPIPVGILNFNYFRVFNRYGQLVFETNQPFKGWDGNVHGRPADAGTYVWEVAGVDYINKPIRKKGTVILIR